MNNFLKLLLGASLYLVAGSEETEIACDCSHPAYTT